MAKILLYQIMDENGNVEISRTVKFPYEISGERIDKEIAEMFLRIDEENKWDEIIAKVADEKNWDKLN